jgi:AcrR family transcriptional regulator
MNGSSLAAALPPTVPTRQRLAHESRHGTQRRRLIAAMASIAAERGRRAAGVDPLCARAGVSKATFYELFTDVDDCFVATVTHAFDRVFAGLNDVLAGSRASWDEHAATTIAALIAIFDRDRETARLCMVEVHSGNATARAIRHAAVNRLARTLAEGSDLEDESIRDATARGAIGAVLELVQDRLAEEPAAPLDDLVWSAIYMALAPFSGREVATRWAERPPAIAAELLERGAGSEPDPDEQLLVTELARVTLLHLESHPGARNIDVARAIGVRHESQISRHLVRLERAGVVARRRQGRVNAWRLTDRGREAAQTLRNANRQDRSDASGSATPSL